jgi:hypothetical protein
VRSGLIHRLEHQLKVPFRAYELLADSGVAIDSGPIADLVMAPGASKEAAAAAASLVGERTVGCLIDQLCTVARKLVGSEGPAAKELNEEHGRLRQLIGGTHPAAFAHAVVRRAAITDPHEIGTVAALIADHHNSSDPRRTGYEPKLRDALEKVVGVWAEVLLAIRDVGRRELAHVAAAIGSLASAELVLILLRMLAEELRRGRVVWEAVNAARARGRPLRVDGRMSWSAHYHRALVSIGGHEVILAMTAYLPDRGQGSFGADAAGVLFELWDRDHRPLQNDPAAYRQDFADVRARRRARQGAAKEPVSAESAAIFAVVEELATPGSDGIAQLHALRLAKIGLALPHGDRAATIGRLLSLPQPPRAKRDLLHALVLAGEVISADLLLEGIQELLREAQTQPWLLEPRQGRLNHWLVLLPFSDKPKVIFEILALLPPPLREPSELRALLAALGQAPSDEVEEVLQVLAHENEGFLDQHEWFAALEKRGTPSSMRLLLALVTQGALDKKHGRDDLYFARHLTSAMRSDPTFRAEVYRAFETLPPSRGRRLIERAMLEAADAEGVLVFVRDRVRHGQPFDGDLYYALERVAVDRRPSSQWIGAHELVGRPVPGLRKDLFAFIAARRPEAGVAQACLNAIDELRELHGPVEDEPRHPDIESNIAWPPV